MGDCGGGAVTRLSSSIPFYTDGHLWNGEEVSRCEERSEAEFDFYRATPKAFGFWLPALVGVVLVLASCSGASGDAGEDLCHPLRGARHRLDSKIDRLEEVRERQDEVLSDLGGLRSMVSLEPTRA